MRIELLIAVILATIICNGIHAQDSTSQVMQKVLEESSDQSIFIIPKGTKLSFVGDGDLLNTINSGKGDIDANTGLGVTLNISRPYDNTLNELDMSFIVNVASTSDTLGNNVRDLGYYLLRPNNKKQSAEFNFDGYFTNNKTRHKRSLLGKNIDGVHFNLMASTNNWPPADSLNLAGLSISLGLFKEFIDSEIRHKKEYSFRIGVNWTWKRMLGDLAFERYDELREKIIGMTNRGFNGLEFYLSLRLNNIKATLSLPLLQHGFLGFAGSDPNLAGLSNSQVLTSISFVGGFPLDTEETERN